MIDFYSSIFITDVQGLSAGLYALDLMCGSHGSKHCNGQRWISFMGISADNGGYAPIQINYKFTDDVEKILVNNQSVFEPMNPSIIPCNSIPPGMPSDAICPCQECSTCLESKGQQQLNSLLSRLSRFIDLQEYSSSFTIYKLSGCATFGLFLYIFIVIVVLVYFLIFNTREKSSYDG